MTVRPLPFERDLAELEDQLRVIEQHSFASIELHDSIRALRVRLNAIRRERFGQLDAWQIVQVARHEHRPQTLDYLDLIFDEFIELHGDRCYADDPAIVTGFARIDGRKVMVVGHRKGRTLEERNRFSWGMARPEGYRKSLRAMKLASKFGLPIITFLDSAGAHPGIGSEERGQAGLIAMNLREMARLETPIIAAVIGEGGSDGALAIGVADYLCMLQFAYYSVMTPEGCAGILWKHVKHADKAALALRLTASDLSELDIADAIVPEPLGGAHRDPRRMAATLKCELLRGLRIVESIEPQLLTEHRYQRYRRIGAFEERSSVTQTPGSP